MTRQSKQALTANAGENLRVKIAPNGCFHAVDDCIDFSGLTLPQARQSTPRYCPDGSIRGQVFDQAPTAGSLQLGVKPGSFADRLMAKAARTNSDGGNCYFNFCVEYYTGDGTSEDCLIYRMFFCGKPQTLALNNLPAYLSNNGLQTDMIHAYTVQLPLMIDIVYKSDAPKAATSPLGFAPVSTFSCKSGCNADTGCSGCARTSVYAMPDGSIYAVDFTTVDDDTVLAGEPYEIEGIDGDILSINCNHVVTTTGAYQNCGVGYGKITTLDNAGLLPSTGYAVAYSDDTFTSFVCGVNGVGAYIDGWSEYFTDDSSLPQQNYVAHSVDYIVSGGDGDGANQGASYQIFNVATGATQSGYLTTDGTHNVVAVGAGEGVVYVAYTDGTTVFTQITFNGGASWKDGATLGAYDSTIDYQIVPQLVGLVYALAGGTAYQSANFLCVESCKLEPAFDGMGLHFCCDNPTDGQYEKLPSCPIPYFSNALDAATDVVTLDSSAMFTGSCTSAGSCCCSGVTSQSAITAQTWDIVNCNDGTIAETITGAPADVVAGTLFNGGTMEAPTIDHVAAMAAVGDVCYEVVLRDVQNECNSVCNSTWTQKVSGFDCE